VHVPPTTGYLPSFWIKLRNLDVAGPALQLPGVSSEVGRHAAGGSARARRLRPQACWHPAFAARVRRTDS
jgi:hypothetical protein